ncbi:MAG: hypothetical protein ABI855_08300 [Bacteroidota bacterium]
MKTKWIVIIVLIVILGVLVYLNEKGIIHWQALTILGAVVLGPIKFIASLFKNDQKEIDKINKKHETVRANEKKYQETVESNLKKHDEKIDTLTKNNQALEEKLKSLEAERENVAKTSAGKSIGEQEEEAGKLFGK